MDSDLRGSQQSFGDHFEDEEEYEYETFDIHGGAEPITVQHIKQINYELGLINLCWPEVINTVFENRTHFPETYYTTTDKEKLALLFAENFRRQFHYLFPERRNLIFVAENECGLQKLVCTTIRPTTLPYLELKAWNTCAAFVADHIDYEPLERATLGPERILGPYTVVKRQLGNSFEMSTVLCSLLNGAGYDGYVVSGYAIQDITQGIRYRTECPVKTGMEEVIQVEEEIAEKKYELRPIPDLRSRFLRYLDQREQDKIIEARLAEEERLRLEREEREKAPFDELHGWRVHAWVLLLPKLDITEPIFIEPSTADWYPIDTNVYTSIESVYNHINYWVNLQDFSQGLGSLQFDLSDESCWDHLFLGEPIQTRLVKKDAAEGIEECFLDEKHLDMPIAWPERIQISHQMLTLRFTNGVKTTRYKRVILQQYGEYVQYDGLKHRISHYSDIECTDLLTVEDIYENRKDCLTTITRDMNSNIVTEHFRQGREDACKKHIYNSDLNIMEAPRIIEYYYDFRLDGLEKIELDPLFMKQFFKNREDLLHYRLTIYADRDEPPPGMVAGTRRIVLNVLEKYHRHEEKVAHDDIAQREFAILDNEIRIKYHYAPGHVTACSRVFVRPSVTELGEGLTFHPELTWGYLAEAGMKPPNSLKLFYLLKEMLADEETVLHRLREVEDELNTFIRLRAIEIAIPQLIVSLFNREQNEEYKIGMKEKEEEMRAQEEREVEQEIDYLAPFLIRFNVTEATLKPDIARIVQAACLKEFKEMLVGRANKLRQQFDKEFADFQRKQNWFANNVSLLNVEEEEEELNEMAAIKYKLLMYDIRMQRHRELSSYRYKAIVNYLKLDPRLACLRAAPVQK